jgi:hypothetical protein
VKSKKRGQWCRHLLRRQIQSHEVLSNGCSDKRIERGADSGFFVRSRIDGAGD